MSLKTFRLGVLQNLEFCTVPPLQSVLKPVPMGLIEDRNDDDVASVVAIEDDERRASDDAFKDVAVGMIRSHFGVGGEQVENQMSEAGERPSGNQGAEWPTPTSK